MHCMLKGSLMSGAHQRTITYYSMLSLAKGKVHLHASCRQRLPKSHPLMGLPDTSKTQFTVPQARHARLGTVLVVQNTPCQKWGELLDLQSPTIIRAHAVQWARTTVRQMAKYSAKSIQRQVLSSSMSALYVHCPTWKSSGELGSRELQFI